MSILLLTIIDTLFQIITLVVIVDVVLSYFMSPYHPIRQTLDRVVEPLLAPIRRMLPQTGMIDFSPFVLIIGLQLIQYLLRIILRSL